MDFPHAFGGRGRDWPLQQKTAREAVRYEDLQDKYSHSASSPLVNQSRGQTALSTYKKKSDCRFVCNCVVIHSTVWPACKFSRCVHDALLSRSRRRLRRFLPHRPRPRRLPGRRIRIARNAPCDHTPSLCTPLAACSLRSAAARNSLGARGRGAPRTDLGPAVPPV